MIPKETFHETGVTALANAIIIQAATDYRRNALRLMHHPHSSEARACRDEIEQFFRSDWFAQLSGLDGERMLGQLKAEMGVD